MKKNNKQVLVVFALLVLLQLILGNSLSIDIFRGFNLANRVIEPYYFWKNIFIQSIVIIFLYLREIFKDRRSKRSERK